MAELERQLRSLPVAWPEAPRLRPVLYRRRSRRPLAAALAALVLAVAVAFAVAPARSAILRFLHLGGVTVERVGALPPAQERPLASRLGPAVTPDQAAAVLGTPFRSPARAPLHARDGIVFQLLATPDPVLLAELRSDGPVLLKKLAAVETGVEPADLGPGAEALWLAGRHVVFVFGAPPRLAGNVLLWAKGDVTYRLEGPSLSEGTALRIARSIDGT